MVGIKKKEVKKQGLRPSQKVKAEKLRKKQQAKVASSSLQEKAANETEQNVVIKQTLENNQNVVPVAIITVKNADGDPDTVAEVLIQNKIDYTPKVSVVMPVYNVELYLRQCLDSVINQTLKEIEIICVDDGSTDSSLEILKEYAAKDNRITVIKQKNLYAGVARNTGLSQAKGEYLSFLDPDDFFELTLFEETYNLAEKENSQIVFYQYTNYNNETKEKEQIAGINKKLSNDVVCTFLTEDLKDSLFTICNPMPWNKLIKRKLVVEQGIRFQSLPASNDVCFSLNIIACSEMITFYYKSLVYYRHNRKDSLKNNRDKNPFNFYEAYKGIYNTLIKKGLYEKYKRTFLTSLASSSLWTYEHTDKAKTDVKNFIKDEIIPHFLSTQDETHLLPEYLQNWLKRVYYPDIIISLTSFPGRIGTVNQTIETLLNQSLKADRVILWLAPEQFPNKEDDLPSELLDLRLKGLTIGWYHDIRSYKKLIPTLREYPEAIIITADDDILYAKDCIEKLYLEHVNNPHSIIAHRISRLYQEDGKIKIFPRIYYTSGKENEYREVLRNPNIWNMQTGCGAVLYPPHCFYKDVLREDLIKQLAPTNDDQWFWAMTALQGYFIRVPEKNDYDVKYVPGSQEGECLWKINDRGEKLYFRDLNNIIKFYSKISDLLKKQKSHNDNILQKIFKTAFFEVHGEYLKSWYKNVTHKTLPLENPKTYNEKLQWLKLYNATPIKTLLADKYLVREWIKEKIGEEYLVPLLGVYDRFEDIDFDALPNQFVIKCNHGSGWNIIVQDKSKLDLDDAKAKLDRWMGTNFAFSWGYELHYREITPKIIIEKYIDPQESNHEIQVWCFNQKIKFISVESIKDTENLVRGTFYPDGTPTEFEISPNHYHKLDTISDMEAFNKAIDLAKKMLVDTPYIRIDFIEWKGSVLFREMTFTSGSGLSVIEPSKYNKKLGDMIKLPSQIYNMDTKKYYKRPRFANLRAYLLFPFYLYAHIKALRNYSGIIVNNIIKELTTYRLDIKNCGRETNAVEITADGKITSPVWFANAQGKGQIVQSSALKSMIKLRIIKDGILHIDFKGQDKVYNNKRFPVWIDYKSIKIDGNEILAEPVITWHDKSYRYEMPVKNGQEINVEIEQQYHLYNEDEIKDIVLKLNTDSGYVKDNVSVIINKLRKTFPIESLETYNKNQFDKICSETTKVLTSYRWDIKNFGNENNMVEIITDNNDIRTPEWFINKEGKGKVLQGNSMKNTVKIKVVNDGLLKIDFRGQDRRYEGKRFPVWIDYKSIKVDGKEILSDSVAVWHDRPYRYEMPVKDGQEIILNAEQQYHEYVENELKDVLFKLNPESKYVSENIDALIDKLKQTFPIIDEETNRKKELENKVSEILLDLTSYRVDIRNFGNEDNTIEITSDFGCVKEPGWLMTSQGKGKSLHDNGLDNTIKVKVVNNGILRIDFRGQDRRYEGKRFPVWIDYKSIKIDGKELLKSPVMTWHDQPYRYEMQVKDGQEIIINLEQQYHEYSESDLKDVLLKLNSNDDYLENNIDAILQSVSAKTNAVLCYSQLSDIPQVVADCFVPMGAACRPAHWLRKYQLRYCSLPFDWMMSFSLNTVMSILKNGISSWFEEYEEDTSKKSNKSRYVTDVKNKIISMHGFPVDKSIEEYMPEFREIFARRYERMKNIFENSKSICFVCNRNDSIYDLILFAKEINRLYPELTINILNIKNSYTEQKITGYSSGNINVYNIDAYDIHEDGNERTNPKSWIGNENLWDRVCRHLSLSVKTQNRLAQESKNKDSAA